MWKLDKEGGKAVGGEAACVNCKPEEGKWEIEEVGKWKMGKLESWKMGKWKLGEWYTEE